MDSQQRTTLMSILEKRFRKHPHRHPNLAWETVSARLEAQPKVLSILDAMEQSGGEPDVVAFETNEDAITFCDCSAESPTGRRSLCYDRAAREGRKKFPPANSVEEMVASLGVELLTEAHYRALQQLGEFDRKTSSWIQTPDDVRNLGGALFCDRRYNQVFTYHNGADSYYAARGFRGMVRV